MHGIGEQCEAGPAKPARFDLTGTIVPCAELLDAPSVDIEADGVMLLRQRNSQRQANIAQSENYNPLSIRQNDKSERMAVKPVALQH